MTHSHVVKKKRCPECAKLGKDISCDNLAEYSDGHSHCYSCGYFISSSPYSFVKNKTNNTSIIKKREVCLPYDCNTDYPDRALHWIWDAGLTKADLLNNNVMWSEKEQRLIFPVFGDSDVIAYQGRDFSLNKDDKQPKWYGHGDLKNTFNIIGKGTKLVLTEDIISAIKVSKSGVQAMPLFGCVVGRERFKRLYSRFGHTTEVLVWLDPDKRKEGAIEAKLGRICGLNCRTIFSERDPKEHSVDEIKEIL